MGTPKLTYWAGRGLAEPLRCIFAAADVKIDNVFLQNKQQMQDLIATGKLAFDQVPLVEIDGLNLVQTVPTAIYLSQKYGFWPADPKEQHTAGSVLASASDARACFVKHPFLGEIDKTSEAADAPNGLWERYAPKWEAMLKGQQGKFVLGATPSLADIAIFETLDFYRFIFGEDKFKEKMGGFPLLLGLHDSVLALGHLRQWRDEERPKVFLELGEYAQVVRATLQ